MPQFEDLTGKRFGRWTVIQRAPNKNTRTSWLCQCDCGKQKEVLSCHLKSGRSQSCGCLAKEIQSKTNLKDLTGQRFGNLTVLARDPSPSCRVRWLCKCDCGTIKSIDGAELRRKKKPTLSCGCLTRERNKHFGDFTALNLSNKKFGMLTPLYIIGKNKYHYNIWHCRCDCGNECDVVSRELMHGDTLSCGCKKNSYRE